MKLNHSFAEGGRQVQFYPDMGSGSAFEPGPIEISKWKKLDSREMGITRSMIPVSPWIVLKVLQSSGFEAYLVGGCVRDLLLNRVPKDFDVITTAALTQIKKKFHRSVIVGRRFPICRVIVKGTVVEVSSFETVAENDKGKEEFILPQMPKGCDLKDLARWRNCMHRDFTVNSLFFDPFVNKIYDYTNAILDIRSSKLRTLIPAQVSFEEDCARILRGLRLAARLNFSFSKETENAIRKLLFSILSLAKSRILMELDYMLSFGAAEASLALLQRYHLLDILLPVQAAHLAQEDHKRSGQSPSLLMELFSNLDRLCSCDHPSHGCLWVAIFAVHLALINNSQQALVLLTFASVLFHGKWKQGVQFARQHAEAAHTFVPEISDCHDSISDDELGQRITQFAEQVRDSVNVLTETGSLQEKMAKKFPGFPCSGLVFVSKKMGSTVRDMFKVLVLEVTTLKLKRESLEINYDSLGRGNVHELRFVLGKIILDTLGCGVALEQEHDKEEKDDLHAADSHQKREMFVESCPSVMDTREHDPVGKKDKKRSTLSDDCEQEQEASKKQKLMVNDEDLSVKGRSKNDKAVASKWLKEVELKQQDLFEDHNCFQMAKKHQGTLAEIGRNFQNYASKVQEKDSSRQLLIKSVPETVTKCQPRHEPLIGDEKPVNNRENKKIAKKHLRVLEGVNWEASVDKCLPQQESSEQSEPVIKGDRSTLPQGKQGPNTVSGKRSKIELKGRRKTLSSLFRG